MAEKGKVEVDALAGRAEKGFLSGKKVSQCVLTGCGGGWLRGAVGWGRRLKWQGALQRWKKEGTGRKHPESGTVGPAFRMQGRKGMSAGKFHEDAEHVAWMLAPADQRLSGLFGGDDAGDEAVGAVGVLLEVADDGAEVFGLGIA